MGDRRLIAADDMASTSTAVTTVPPQVAEDTSVERVTVITLRPPANVSKADTKKKVVWTEDTVDNEHMNKKKSKCCCIYEKPRKFGEDSDSDSDDECEHCFGHVERKKMKKHLLQHHQHGASTDLQEEDSVDSMVEPTTTVTLIPADPCPGNSSSDPLAAEPPSQTK